MSTPHVILVPLSNSFDILNSARGGVTVIEDAPSPYLGGREDDENLKHMDLGGKHEHYS